MCYIVFIGHSLHWRCIKIALRKYVIMFFDHKTTDEGFFKSKRLEKVLQKFCFRFWNYFLHYIIQKDRLFSMQVPNYFKGYQTIQT